MENTVINRNFALGDITKASVPQLKSGSDDVGQSHLVSSVHSLISPGSDLQKLSINAHFLGFVLWIDTLLVIPPPLLICFKLRMCATGVG